MYKFCVIIGILYRKYKNLKQKKNYFHFFKEEKKRETHWMLLIVVFLKNSV